MLKSPSLSRVYVILAVVGAAAVIALATIYFLEDDSGRRILRAESAKGLIQLIGIGVIGAIIKFLFDTYQETQRRIDDLRAVAREKSSAMAEFRRDKIGRIVQVTNTLRRAPVLIEAHRSARTYNEQMRQLIDAGLELRLVRHEIDALGGDEANIAFPAWPEIRAYFRPMDEYFGWLQQEFRGKSKILSELQAAAERDRSRQQEVWEEIRRLPSIVDLLAETNAQSRETRFYREYFVNYESILASMTRVSYQQEN
jgi:uncharacterized membrane protein YeaQ/YmgE (transglycosylase-associated protein family)